MNKKIKWMAKRGLALVCAFTLCSSNLVVYADSDVDRLEEKKSELENELESMNQDLSSLTTQINDLVTQIEETNSSIELAELDLAAAKLSEQMQYEAMKKRIKYIYEAGETSLLHVLLTSEDMSEFLNNAEFIFSITSYDRSMLEELQEAREAVETQEADLQATKTSLEEMQTQLETDQQSLNEMINNTSNELAVSKEELEAAIEAQKAVPVVPPAGTVPSVSEPSSGGNSSGGGTSVAPVYPSTTDDLVLFAAILQCEAGSTNYDALLAVATVIMNRVESSRYPNSISGVVYQRGQFSPTWNGSLNRVLSKGPQPLCYQVAQDALNGSRLASVSNCYQFRSASTGHSGTYVGGNVFF